jgi:DNA-binding transcriptional MerR regulator
MHGLSHSGSWETSVVEIGEEDVKAAAAELLQLLDALDGGANNEQLGTSASAPQSVYSDAEGHETAASGPATGERRSNEASDTSSINGLAFRGTDVARIAGITYRQLDYWARTGLVTPSLATPSGQSLFGFTDVFALRLAKRLIDLGIGLPVVRTSVDRLRAFDERDIAGITLLSDGEQVFFATSDDEVIDSLSHGQAVFAIALGQLWREVEGEATRSPSEDGVTQPHDEVARRSRSAS